MHLRIVRTRTKNGTNRFAQLVKSYRRDDGMPAHKVVAGLGALSDEEIHNLRLALKASRTGQALVLPLETQAQDWNLRVMANLQYLDLAVALSMWRYWKLSELFNRLLPKTKEYVASSSVIAALVLQRCVSPGSKLYAQRWFPKTALPELLAMSEAQFNNSRIHRALEELDQVDAKLQHELPLRYQQRDGVFAALFLDVTDTYFQGRGCGLAERDRTKEGLRNVKKIGIVVLCNERGYPLRWQVVPGKRRDPPCMRDMVEQISELDWIADAPIVCDRAMGNARSVGQMLRSGLRFLTATTKNEIGSYTDELPGEFFDELEPIGSELSLQYDIEQVSQLAEKAGLEKVNDLLYVKELGVQKRLLNLDRELTDEPGQEPEASQYEGGAAYLALARIYGGMLEQKQIRNKAKLAEEQGLSRARVTQLLNLLKLDEQLQQKVLRGDYGYVSERHLRQAAQVRSVSSQRKLLEDKSQWTRAVSQSMKLRRGYRRVGRQEVELRLVAYFNPRMFVEHRHGAKLRRDQFESYIKEINERLRIRTQDCDKVKASIRNKLTADNMFSLYNVTIESVRIQPGIKCLQVRLEFDEAEWKRRRRLDGFVLLLGHPELPHTAAQLVKLYRDKDMVEKDFRTIKEVIKLRPIFHYTDPKVRAHVTLCMLALLLERTLEQRLRQSSAPMTATACFEQLRFCHLNMLRQAPQLPPTYQRTEPTQEQEMIIRCLRLHGLLDPEVIQTQITPRTTE